MAIVTLREHLIIDYPGESLPLLQALATFARVGRLRPGQHRVVRYWRLTNNGQRLVLPRGLAGKVLKLLPDSIVRDERLRVRPVQFGFRASLRDYQSAMVDAIDQRGGGVMVMPPAGGKTHTAMALIDRWQQPALFLVHQLRLKDKTLSDARALFTLPRGGLGSIGESRVRIGTHLTVAMIQTLAQKPRIVKDLIPRIGTIVVDECVVGGTLVDGRPIREIGVGDTVTAYDVVNDTFQLRAVTRVLRREAPAFLVAIGAGPQRIVCTPNHPILTRSGWKRADGLNTGDQVLVKGGNYETTNPMRRLRTAHGLPDDTRSVPHVQTDSPSSRDGSLVSTQSCAMRVVREPICAGDSLATDRMAHGTTRVLLEDLRPSVLEAIQFDHDGTNQPKVCLGTDDQTQSDVPPRCAGKSECRITSYGTQAVDSRRPWPTDARTSAVAIGGARMAGRSRRENGYAKRFRLSSRLQSRYREYRDNGRHRSGRVFTYNSGPTSAGLQENGVSQWMRVDHLAILQRGRDGEFERMCPEGFVYNLEVADFHTFIANGIVTHNCHHVGATSYAQVLSAFPARHVLGLSATPSRDDGLGPMVYAMLGGPVRLSREALADKGVVMDPTIYVVGTGWEPPGDVPFHAAEEARVTDASRNVLLIKLIALVRRRGQRVLVLVEREKHALFLAQMLSQAGIAAHAAFGRLPKPLQDQRFRWMEQGKTVVVATKLANEGLDWPALDCLVLAAPGRSPTVLEQRTGRIARMAEGKTLAVVYDLADEGPTYQDQTRARMEQYHAMGYRVRRFRWPTT